MYARRRWNRTKRFWHWERIGLGPLRSRNGRGFGRGRGFGVMGRGFGRRFAAVPQPTKEDELVELKAYAKNLEAELSEIKKRIEEIGK